MEKRFEAYQKAKKTFEVCKINFFFLVVLAFVAFVFGIVSLIYSFIEGFNNTLLLSIIGPSIGSIACLAFILLSIYSHKKLALAKSEVQKEKANYVSWLKQSIIKEKNS